MWPMGGEGGAHYLISRNSADENVGGQELGGQKRLAAKMSWRPETVGGFCDFPTLAVSGQPKILGSGTKQSWGGGQKANVHSGPETWRTKTIGGQNVLAARNCWWILRFSNIGGFWPTKISGNKVYVQSESIDDAPKKRIYVQPESTDDHPKKRIYVQYESTYCQHTAYSNTAYIGEGAAA